MAEPDVIALQLEQLAADISRTLGPRIGDKLRISSWCLEESSTRAQVLTRLRRLAGLKRDWDTYGASPISKLACETAAGFMFEVWQRMPQAGAPEVFPDTHGGVRLEWTRGDDDVAVCFEPGRIVVYTAHGDDEFEAENDLSQAYLAVAKLFEC